MKRRDSEYEHRLWCLSGFELEGFLKLCALVSLSSRMGIFIVLI